MQDIKEEFEKEFPSGFWTNRSIGKRQVLDFFLSRFSAELEKLLGEDEKLKKGVDELGRTYLEPSELIDQAEKRGRNQERARIRQHFNINN